MNILMPIMNIIMNNTQLPLFVPNVHIFFMIYE